MYQKMILHPSKKSPTRTKINVASFLIYLDYHNHGNSDEEDEDGNAKFEKLGSLMEGD